MLTSTAFAQDIILADIDGEPLTLEEFEQEYSKAIGSRTEAADDSLAEYADYLERYVNFKIKLMEAHDAGYFEDSELLSEINSYRTSFAKPYLMDNAVINPMVEDLYQRRQEFIHASHLMMTLTNDSSPEDTLYAWEKISSLQDSLAAGVSFGDLAFRHSEDPSASSSNALQGFRGNLGWFTGGQMIQAFEDAAYSTTVGETSDIVRSAYGYHLIQVHDREPTLPARQASHIMIRFSGDTPDDSLRTRAKIDSLKSLIDSGTSFEEIAMAHSEDPGSADLGGSLSGLIEHHNRNIDRTFHDALFALDSLGQVSNVVETPFGLHLIRYDEASVLPTFDQEYERLSRLVQSLPRIKTAESELEKFLRTLYISSVDTLKFARLVEEIPPDSLKAQFALIEPADSTASLITLADSVYTFQQFARFVSDQLIPVRTGMTSTDLALEYADAFLNDRVVFYHSFELEKSDAEFQQIMDEFRDGLALFAIMEDSVWNASSEDSLALLQHYEEYTEEYQWPDRFRLIEVSGSPDSLLTEAIEFLTSASMADLQRAINSDSTWTLRVDTVLVADSTNSIYDRATGLALGEHTEILSDRARRLFLYVDGMEPARLKTFEEAKTEVMSEIQILLEEDFHQRLRSKFKVTTFPERLEYAFQ
ncbi:MAG: peptidylprolyl isomerase [Bacteroidetes bacterium]|nr:peptidylprolyl isomerase [Bacteroidota bacterium]